MPAAALVEVIRGEAVECVHHGHAVIADGSGTILMTLGDPAARTFMRSAAKPLQALPLIMREEALPYRLKTDEIAIMCGSHYGEPRHLEVLRRLADRIEVSESDLRCGAVPSIKYSVALEQARRGETWTQFHNDCSGKHLGMLALSRSLQAPFDDYTGPNHPVQREIRSRLMDVLALGPEELAFGVDGCSVPTYSVPLHSLAQAYARLTKSDPGVPWAGAARRIITAMASHPRMIGGSGSFCSALVAATRGRLTGKIGAEGVYCVGFRDADRGLAVKIVDGNMKAPAVAVMGVLRDLGMVTAAELKRLWKFLEVPVTNDRGGTVGLWRPAFRLEKSSDIAGSLT